MNDESFVLRQLAIRERRQFLDLLYSTDGAAPKRAGLVALSRAVYLLATRHIARPEEKRNDAPEDVKLLWEWEWYFQYLEALVELTPRLQVAIHDGRITPRGIRTSAPLALDQIRQWLDIDAKTAIAASAKTFMAGAGPDKPYSLWAGWVDASVLPRAIFVTVNDLAEWGDAEGIATPDEISTLLSGVQHSTSGTPEKAAPPVPEVMPTENAKNGPAWYDIEQERGCRRLILENWKDIVQVSGPDAKASQILRQLKIALGPQAELPSLKTVHNCRKQLLDEKLIP